MLQAFLWALTCFVVSTIMAWISGDDDGSFIHNVADFFSSAFSLATWGCGIWWLIEAILWALPIMVG